MYDKKKINDFFNLLNNMIKQDHNIAQELLDNIFNKINIREDKLDFCIDCMCYMMDHYTYDIHFRENRSLLFKREPYKREINLPYLELEYVLENKHGICSHFSIIYKELLNRKGIECDNILCISNNKEIHMINKITLDNVCFYVDIAKAISLFKGKSKKLDIIKKCFFLSEEDLEAYHLLIFGKLNDIHYQYLYHNNSNNLLAISKQSQQLGYDYILLIDHKKKIYQNKK